MKKISTIFTVALLIAATFTAKAVTFTGDISGQVIEQETKQPVAFAKIIFENGNNKIEVTANEYGYYSVKQIPMGKYEMHVVFNNKNFVRNNVKVRDSYTSTIDFAVPSTTTTSQGEVVKQGNIIQDGQLIIIQNKPMRLFA